MTIMLGDLALPNSLVWLERYTSQGVLANSTPTLGGKLRIRAAKLQGGFPITLQAGDDHGWLTRTQIESLLAMAADPGAVYTLLFNDKSYSVAFRHSDAPAVETAPLIPRTADSAGDYFVGQIKLIVL